MKGGEECASARVSGATEKAGGMGVGVSQAAFIASSIGQSAFVICVDVNRLPINPAIRISSTSLKRRPIHRKKVRRIRRFRGTSDKRTYPVSRHLGIVPSFCKRCTNSPLEEPRCKSRNVRKEYEGGKKPYT